MSGVIFITRSYNQVPVMYYYQAFPALTIIYNMFIVYKILFVKILAAKRNSRFINTDYFWYNHIIIVN